MNQAVLTIIQNDRLAYSFETKWLVPSMVIMDMTCSWFVVGPLSSFSVTVIGNRLAYITSTGWREISLKKILLISILGNKLCQNMLSSSYLFSNWEKIFLPSYHLHTYARLLKVVGNKVYTLSATHCNVIWPEMLCASLILPSSQITWHFWQEQEYTKESMRNL
jgi:hypothetical protein